MLRGLKKMIPDEKSVNAERVKNIEMVNIQ